MRHDGIFARATIETPIMGTNYSGTVNLELIKGIDSECYWYAGENWTGVKGETIDDACRLASVKWGGSFKLGSIHMSE